MFHNVELPHLKFMKDRQYLCRLFLSAVLLAGVFAAEPARAQVSVSNVWSIGTTEGRAYVVITGEHERGVAYNRLNNHAYIVSKAATPTRVAIVDGDTGADLGALNVTGITGGTFVLTQIGVADDGSIYAANLTVGSVASPFKIYRWATEAAAPALVYSGSPSGAQTLRYGDAIDVRGEGTNTQIIASTGGTASTNLVAVFRPADETLAGFTATPVLVSGVGPADFAKGIGFGPTNTFFGKNTVSGNLRHCRFDLATGSGALLTTFSIATAISAINYDPTNGLLAGVSTPNALSPHTLLVYDVSGAAAVQLASFGFPAPSTNNVNAVGGVDVSGDRIIGVDPRNGVLMAKIHTSALPVRPAVTQQPASQTVVDGGYTTLSVAAAGTKPLSYQWCLQATNLLVDATNSTLNLTNLTAAQAGAYSVKVTNVAGVTNSNPANITLSPAVHSLVATTCWRLAPGASPFIASDNNQRGLAYNPGSGNLILVSRTPTNGIHVLDATDGTYLRSLDISGIGGGTFAVNMVACGPDGCVYVGNLTTGGTNDPFKLYVYANDDAGTAPSVAWSGDPGSGINDRWGDNFDVRGFAGAGEAILGARNSKRVAVLQLFSGPSSPAISYDVPAAENGNFGLSIVWGQADTCWGKSSGTAIRHVSLDPNTHLGEVLRTITSYPTMSVIALDPENDYLAGVTLETPDTVRLVDLTSPPAAGLELDTEFFAADNANANGTGAIRFGPNKLFALDTNNGLLALGVGARLRYSVAGSMLTLNWAGSQILQATPDLSQPFTNVVGAVTGYMADTSLSGQLFYRLKK